MPKKDFKESTRDRKKGRSKGLNHYGTRQHIEQAIENQSRHSKIPPHDKKRDLKNKKNR